MPTTTYRTCPRSGLQFEPGREADDRQRRRGVVFLLIGGILAIGVVLTRWPAVHWLAGRHLLPGADRARHRHADLLDHLLRDRGAVLLLVDAAALPTRDAEGSPGSPSR
jgi:hypothetical protein